MKKFTGSLVAIFVSLTLSAQQNIPVQYQSSRFSIEKSVTVDPMDISEDWKVHLQNMEMPKPGTSSYRGQLLSNKNYYRNKYPRTVNFNTTTQRAVRASDPVTGTMMEGNQMGNGVPNDNDMAISDEGFIVSVINSTIMMYDTQADTLMKNISLGAFTLPLNIQQSKFDPKIIYDPMMKRFILVFLNGSTYSTSKVIICFSTTSNPTDPWNMYKLTGNPLNNDTWSDYPVVGISNMDLFIGVNTFTNGSTNNSGFTEGCFWQIGLAEGYNGDSLQTAYYHDILAPNDTLFNITPIPSGAENLNLDMFLLSNKNVSATSDSVYLLHISNPLAFGTPTLTATSLQSDKSWFVPVDAEQPNGNFFDTGDSRILGGFQVGDQIQYVHCTTDTTTGLTGIYHGMIYDLYTNPVLKGRVFLDSSHYIGYPNIAWTAVDTNDCRSIITFDYVSSTDPGGFAAIMFDSDSSYSNIINLKSGNSYVDVISGTDERWGDYSGIQRKYNEPCKIWAAGHYGKSSSSNGTWIAEVASESICATNPFAAVDENKNNAQNINVYPNPASDLFTTEFSVTETQEMTFEIYDLNGKLVFTLLNDKVKKGNNRFQFSVQYLTPGIYFLKANNKAGIVFTRKIIRN